MGAAVNLVWFLLDIREEARLASQGVVVQGRVERAYEQKSYHSDNIPATYFYLRVSYPVQDHLFYKTFEVPWEMVRDHPTGTLIEASYDRDSPATAQLTEDLQSSANSRKSLARMIVFLILCGGVLWHRKSQMSGASAPKDGCRPSSGLDKPAS